MEFPGLDCKLRDKSGIEPAAAEISLAWAVAAIRKNRYLTDLQKQKNFPGESVRLAWPLQQDWQVRFFIVWKGVEYGRHQQTRGSDHLRPPTRSGP